MYLHENQEDWNELVARAAKRYALEESYVVKDYFIYLTLKLITTYNPDIVFKGGTCLSKCHNAIARFSEDIDLGLEVDHATEGQRKRMKTAVTQAVAEMGLSITNLDETRSRREFNKYLVPLPSSGSRFASDTLILETAVMAPASPAVVRSIDSYLYRLCIEEGFNDVVTEYKLEPFELMVNSIERTYIDKIFALCDYYLAGPLPPRQSRHIYDLHKLTPSISFDDEFIELFFAVRKQRKRVHRCFSAQEDVDISSVLKTIVDDEIYREDYENITMPLLFEDVSYDEAITSLRKITAFIGNIRNHRDTN